MRWMRWVRRVKWEMDEDVYVDHVTHTNIMICVVGSAI